MKKINRIISIIMAVVIILSVLVITPISNSDTKAATGINDKRACWISYLDMEIYLRNRTEAQFRTTITAMYNNLKMNNMNTVIMQVRPMGDALYPSSYYPWSTYINSSGNNPGYDPLEIMIELAKEKGLEFEAWVNPYRISLSDVTTNNFVRTPYYEKYKSFIIEYKNAVGETCLVLDPSKQESRDLITNGVKEIVENYDVDAIHFDDYFYVNGMANDLPVANKKANVNALITEVYSAIKKIDKHCEFGISPAGNLDNARAQGADIDTWLSNPGYVDYLMPQIYWSDSYKTSSGYTTMFSNRCNEWMQLNKIGVQMYVGLAFYRSGENSSTDKGWSTASNNLETQYRSARSMGYDGYALFRYQWIDKPIATAELKNLTNYVATITQTPTYDASSFISYSTHIQDIGWQSAAVDGGVAGTSGFGKRLESISIKVGNKIPKLGVTYRTHIQDYGWSEWSSDGKESGTTGKGKRLEAIQIKLTGENADKYEVYYRTHIEDYGWLDWACNGKASGSATYGKRMEAIQIKIVHKGDPAPGEVARSYVSRDIRYITHIEDYGWKGHSYDGEVNGTTGESKRLEAINIALPDSLINGGVTYRVHCQDYGWLPWVSNGALSGTTGKSKRLEGIEIKLTGEIAKTHDVQYRVHCQDYGWLPWVSNGELSGTMGESKRLESIQIRIVKKK